MSSSTPEGKVKLWIDKVMKEAYPHAFRYRPPGVGRFGRNGMPDLTYLIKANELFSVYVAIEAKVPGNVPTGLQMKTLKELASQGAVAAVVTGKDTAKMERIINEVNRRILLANEKPRTSPIRSSETDYGILATEQACLCVVRTRDGEDIMSALGNGHPVMLWSCEKDANNFPVVNFESGVGIRAV